MLIQTDTPVQQMQNTLGCMIYIYTKTLTAGTTAGVYICMDDEDDAYCQASL